jgi:hypothetical protein
MEKKKIKNNQKEDMEDAKIKIKFFTDLQFSSGVTDEVKNIFKELENVDHKQSKDFQDSGKKGAKKSEKTF